MPTGEREWAAAVERLVSPGRRERVSAMLFTPPRAVWSRLLDGTDAVMVVDDNRCRQICVECYGERGIHTGACSRG